MAEKKKVKKKISADTVLIFAALAVIAVYVFSHIYSATNISLETVTAEEATVYETVEAKALVVRSEKQLDGKTDSLTVPCIDDGEKVGVNGNIAMTFSSEASAEDYSRLKDLHSKLDYYEELQSRSSVSVTDVATLEKDTINDINNYIRAVSKGDISDLSDYADEINDKLIRRKMLVGEEVDFSQITDQLRQQINSINADTAKPKSYITSSEAGVFSSYSDGLEAAFDYDSIVNIDADTLNSYIEKAEGNEYDGDTLGKLIDKYKWYMCCVIDADDTAEIVNGQSLEIAFKDSDEIITCTVVCGADPDLGAEQTVLILESNEMNGAIAAMRVEDIEIRTASYTGFKLPTKAIHLDEDGRKCVYALIEGKAKMRHGEIIYTTNDYVIMTDGQERRKIEEAKPEEEKDPNYIPVTDPIKYYDQIITKGKDLHDGKDYSE